MNHLFIVDKKDPIVKLYLSKLCIKDLFKVLLYVTCFYFSIKNKSSII